jgi:uncharacterized membrane protein YeaQ/YmgE (transglycosylase-associated protein family)
MGIVATILIGIAAGWLAGQIMKGRGWGLAGDLVLGILGSIVGRGLFALLGLYSGGSLVGELVVATVGAMALVALARYLKRA